jgi:hypothetical protein
MNQNGAAAPFFHCLFAVFIAIRFGCCAGTGKLAFD